MGFVCAWVPELQLLHDALGLRIPTCFLCLPGRVCLWVSFVCRFDKVCWVASLTKSVCLSPSWFASPLDLQADSRTHVWNGSAPLMPPRYLHLDLPRDVVRRAGSVYLHTFARWHLLYGVVEIDIETSALVLLCKMRCMSLLTVDFLMCSFTESFRNKYSFLFSLSASLSPYWRRPLVMPRDCCIQIRFVLTVQHKSGTAQIWRDTFAFYMPCLVRLSSKLNGTTNFAISSKT